MTLEPTDPVTALPGVGGVTARRLADGLGIRTVEELLRHYPRTYHDAGEVLDVAEVAEGEPATLIGEVRRWTGRRVPPRGRRRRPLDLLEGEVRQASGNVFRVTYFNQSFRRQRLPEGSVVAFSGVVKRFRHELQLAAPEAQLLGRVADDVDPDAAARRLEHQRLLAVYPATEGVTNFALSELVEAALAGIGPLGDWVDPSILDEEGLVDLDTAIRCIHRPRDHAERRTARRRLAFDELFGLQLGVQWRRVRLEAETVGLDNAPVDGGAAEAFLKVLPFPPTAAQRRAFDELGGDLASQRAMHRLLQGDVGSGKTLVAVWAMLCAVDNGRQAALMAPTAVLAEQHHRTLTELLAPLGVNVLDGLRVELLTSATPVAQRRRILGSLTSGEVDLIVGTHALLEEGVRFADLGVTVIDEQHRFGVAQRVTLMEKSADAATTTTPDVLVMTATPIPRSLALTVYGDLDVTVLDELPPGRQPVVTALITPEEHGRRARVYDFVRREAAQGRRAFVVCPFVDPSDVADGTAVVDEHARLADGEFSEVGVALVHGRMTPAEKDAAMTAFRTGEAAVLVATTVVEVGVDVPEATMILIEDAERFGVSQLHQLRGRVGRGTDRSYCVLFAGWSGPLADDARRRLEVVAANSDGFALAEADLELRGEGQLFGRAQSGITDLRLARLSRDRDLVAATRRIAARILATDPGLDDPVHAGLKSEVLRRYEDDLDALGALETG